MKQVDYIIVGLGIAGISICEQLENNNKSYIVFDSGLDTATKVAGGVYNPLVLKRFSMAWRGKEFLNYAIFFYKKLSEKLGVELLIEMPIFRIFNSVEEQNDWTVASDKLELGHYMVSEIVKNNNNAIIAPFGLGEVSGSGMVDTEVMLSSYKEYLQKVDKIYMENFDYQILQENVDTILYKHIKAKKIIFAEGANVVNNPFFPKEYLIPNKGEYSIINAPELQMDVILKGHVFVIPLGEDCYKVGATYSPDNFSKGCTEEAKNEIIKSLKKMISCPFEIVGQVTGIRPTTKDLKPLLGNFKESDKKIFFNGLGTRGITMAPMLSEDLYDYLEKGDNLSEEIDIRRMVK